jgi:hypothetical protein
MLSMPTLRHAEPISPLAPHGSSGRRAEEATKIRALAVALGLMVALAAPPAHAVHIIGVGVQSCRTWTADRRQGGSAASQDKQWVVGFLSGAATWSPDLNPMEGIDANAVFAWVDNYCRAHPLVKIIDAAIAFVKEHPGP